MIEALVSFGMFRTFPRRQQAIHLGSNLQSINHFIFGITRMYVSSLNRNPGASRIEVLVLQLSLETAINGVSEFRTESLHVEIVYSPAHFLVRSETDTDFPVFDLGMCHQILGCRHDLGNTRLIVSS